MRKNRILFEKSSDALVGEPQHGRAFVHIQDENGYPILIVTDEDGDQSFTYPRVAGAEIAFANDVLIMQKSGAPVLASDPDFLGDASGFAALGASGVTNTGSSVLTGDLGSSPTGSITGFPPGTYSGALHSADAAAAAAQVSLTAAYNDLAGRAVDQNLSGQDLGGMTLQAGVYKFNTSAGLTGILTLDAQNNPEAEFVFQIGSTLTSAVASSVILINGAEAGNVYWQVGSSATIGTTSAMKGNILAQITITMNTGAVCQGSLLARTGAVTLDANAVSIQEGVVEDSDGTGAGVAGPGSLLVDTVNFDIYINAGSKAVPDWKKVVRAA